MNLKFCLLNAENLFLLFDHPPSPDSLNLSEAKWASLSSSLYTNKSLKKCLELAKVIQEIDPDILMLCEVGGLESLKNFNSLLLNNNYSVALIEGNSDRNIDVGYLVHRRHSFYFDILSNKNKVLTSNFPTKAKGNKFTRDVAELRLFQSDRNHPFLILLLTHLKSQLDKDNIDPGGFEKRRAEVIGLLEICDKIELDFPQIPLAICGDFNGNASFENTDLEFQAIYDKTNWRDVLSIEGLSLEQKSTHYQVRQNGKVDAKQIDYCFLNSSCQRFYKAQSSFVYRYKDEFGLAHGPPLTLEAKESLLSDHYPIVFELVSVPIF